MSVYIVEEPNECKMFVDDDVEYEQYWTLYSKKQKKRFIAVLRQLKDTWYSVYRTINNLRNLGGLDVDKCNDIMLKIHKMFIIEHKHQIEYYNEEKLRLRRQKGYLSKKINKLKNSKQKI